MAAGGPSLCGGAQCSLAAPGEVLNMRAPQGMKRTALMKATVLSCVVSLMLLTQVVAAASPSSSSSSPPHPKLKYNNNNARRQDFRRHRGSHHLPLTDEQKADQNLQFMLSLYRSAAGPDGRPKRHRMFGSNTVQLLRPLASSVDYLLMASRDHQYTFTVEYNLDGVPLEQLVRASFVHLRSPSSSATTQGGGSGGPALRCRAQITSLGEEDGGGQRRRTATLEPHDRWTETDITAHVSGHILQQDDDAGSEGRSLTLTAQYWCAEPGWAHHNPASSWWQPPCGGGSCGGTRAVRGWSRERRRRRSGDHLEVPSLLLYLEEDQDVDEWMEELLGMEEVEAGVVREPPPPPPLRPSNNHQRYRRSKDSTNSSLPSSSSTSSSSSGPSTRPSPDMLKGASSSSPPPSSSSAVDRAKDHKKTSAASAALAGRCKLHSFRLSFKELDWGHYFIAPPIYNPRFCRGDCPRILHYGYHSPNHAIVQTVIRELEVGDVPAPSCVPYHYMPMSVLVVHKRKVEYRELEDMVAESCTCR